MRKKTAFIVLLLLLVLGGIIYWRFPNRLAVRPSSPPSPPPPISSIPSTPGSSSTSELSSTGGKARSTLEPVFSPRPGESLEFDANISRLNSAIANIKLDVVEKRDFLGKPAWHFQAFAHTENPYRMVFELDDRFDSYSDPNSFASHQYEMHLSERGQRVDSQQRMLFSPKDPAPPDATAARVLPGTRDPLGMLHYLRSVDWSKTSEVESPVYDGRKLYQVRAFLQSKSESVTVPAGKYNASKIEIKVSENGTEMKDAHFLLYLANNPAHTPVLMEAVLPIATARVELTKAN